MKEWKMHDMENQRMENAHPEKDRIYHHWKKVENASLLAQLKTSGLVTVTRAGWQE